MEKRTTIIAEVGENHLADADIAMKMVEEAAAAGADVVKFQSYKGEDVPETDPEREWFTKVELTDDLHFRLRDFAKEKGIRFLSAPFTIERARFLVEELGLRSIKVASSEMTNHRLLGYLNGRVDEVLLSTGMGSIEEIRESVAQMGKIPSVTVMHCVTQYPAEDANANLRAIPVMKEAFPECEIGYSDHTMGLDACVMAVGLGATVLEKHFTLGKELPGTDHLLSATPEELGELVSRVRRAETLLGEGAKVPCAAELEIREFVRTRWRKD